MRLRLAGLLLLAISATAAADEVRDHRVEPAPGPQPATTTRVYRRRPGPRFMLPLKIDLGAAATHTSFGMAPGIAGAIGVHWASLSPRPTDTDVGIGVFGAALGAPQDPQMTTSNTSVLYGGAYLELAHTLSKGNWWRTWASGRGEYVASSVFGTEHTGFGASARLSAELYASGVGIEPRGVFLGTYAVGLYAEAGLRDLAPGVSAFQATAGLTFRTPLVFMP